MKKHILYRKYSGKKDTDEKIQLVIPTELRHKEANEKKPPKPLKVISVPGWDVGPDEIKAKQKEDDSLKKYWDLVVTYQVPVCVLTTVLLEETYFVP